MPCKDKNTLCSKSCTRRQRPKLRVSLVLLACIALFGTVRLYYFLTDDFRLSNITYPEAIDAPQDSAVPDLNIIEKAARQRFYYLGKGAQVYAFTSEDGQYVLKFFKFKHLKPNLWAQLIPPIGPLKAWKEAQVARKKRKLEGLFTGYRIAYEHDLHYSGLLALHLHPPSSWSLPVELVDKLGRIHTIDLGTTVFVLQRKGQTLRQVLQAALDNGDLKTAQERLFALLAMYKEEYGLGVWDRDHGVTHNTGFLGASPFHLDVGKISYQPPPLPPSLWTEDLRLVAVKIHAWIALQYPQYVAPLRQAVDARVEEIVAGSDLPPQLPKL